MKCARCQFDNPESMNFCGNCGAALMQPCRSCGAQNPDDFRFCGNCGSALARPGPAAALKLSDQGERRQLTVMFCDLVGSTAMSERLDPEDLQEVIRGYQQAVAQVVGRYGGHIAQYLGDGLLVYFGFPRAHEDDARRAVQAGMEILSSISELNDAHVGENVSLTLRIGVHTGPVVTGEIGEPGSNVETLALGATPNVAARVQGEAAPGSMVLTTATRALVQPYFELAELGERMLKGLADPVRLYRVQGVASEDRAPEAADPVRTPFVGREAEVETMISFIEQAAGGRGCVVLIKGEPGIGKSRLQREVRTISGIGAERWLTCHCSAYHQNTALYPIAQLVGHVFGITGGDTSQQRRAKLRAGLAELSLPADAEDLLGGGVLGLPAESPDSSVPNPVVRRKRILNTVADLLLQSAAAYPRVIAVEDLHWADPSTLEFLEVFVERVRDAPVVVVMSHRPEFVPMWHPPRHQSSIELQRLNVTDAEAIVDAYGVTAALRRNVVERTDGIPLFLEELTRSMLERDVSARDGSGPDPVIPDTLRDLLMARLDALGSAKEFAQLGALLGRRFHFEVLAAVSDATHAEIYDNVQRVVDSGLLIRTGELPHAIFMFKHALIQDVAYESLLRRRRRELHERVAVCLLSQFPEIAENEPEILAWHYEEAGRYPEASEAYRAAAIRALAGSAYDEAVHHLQGALKALAFEPKSANRDEREIALLQMITAPLSARHGYTYPELEKLYNRTLELVSRNDLDSGLTLVLFNIWAYRAVRGERRASAEAAENLYSAAQAAGDREKGLAAYALGSNAFFLGEPERALAHLTPVAEKMRARTRDPDPNLMRESRATGSFIAWIVQSWALTQAGYLDQGWDSVSDAVAFAESLGDPFMLAQALTHQAVVSHELARSPQEIAAIARRTHAISEGQGLAQTLQSSRLHLGWAAAEINGDDQTAAMQDSIDATRAMGTLLALPHRLMMLAETHVQLGRTTEALETIDECLTMCATSASRLGEADAHRLRGILLANAGDDSGAEASFARSIDIARGRDLRLDELRATTALADFLAQRKRGAEVRDRLREIVSWFSEGLETPHLAGATETLRRIDGSTVLSAS